MLTASAMASTAKTSIPITDDNCAARIYHSYYPEEVGNTAGTMSSERAVSTEKFSKSPTAHASRRCEAAVAAAPRRTFTYAELIVFTSDTTGMWRLSFPSVVYQPLGWRDQYSITAVEVARNSATLTKMIRQFMFKTCTIVLPYSLTDMSNLHSTCQPIFKIR